MPTLSRAQVRAILAPCRAAMPDLHDATYVLTRTEYVQGRTLPIEVMDVRWRAPGDLHIRWVGEAHRGRQVLYRPDHDHGKLRIKVGRLIPTVKVGPFSPLARRQSRSPIWMAGIASVQRAILDQDTFIDEHHVDDAIFTDLGVRPVGDTRARGYRAILPKDRVPALYSHKAEIWLSQTTPTLAAVQVWSVEDGRLRLVEDHTFSKVRLNTGLTAADFEPGRVGV